MMFTLPSTWISCNCSEIELNTKLRVKDIVLQVYSKSEIDQGRTCTSGYKGNECIVIVFVLVVILFLFYPSLKPKTFSTLAAQ